MQFTLYLVTCGSSVIHLLLQANSARRRRKFYGFFPWKSPRSDLAIVIITVKLILKSFIKSPAVPPANVRFLAGAGGKICWPGPGIAPGYIIAKYLLGPGRAWPGVIILPGRRSSTASTEEQEVVFFWWYH